MKILVNRLTALRQKTGIGRYTAELLRCLPAQASENDDILVYPGPFLEKTLAWLRSLRKHRSPTSAPPKAPGRGADVGRLLAGWHFRLCRPWQSPDLYHEPNYIPWPSSWPTVATIHDLSVLLHPEWHPRERVAFFEKHFDAALDNCRHFLAVSEFTRREMISKLGVPQDRITCTYNGIGAEFQPLPAHIVEQTRERLGLPPTFIVYVGTLEPRKNLAMLMRAYVALPETLRSRCPLVLAGGWGWNAAELAEYYASTGKAHGIMHLGYVADADLPALYNAARALVFPPFYEGFGLPPLEMMACGGAVIASNAGAIVETAGNHAHLLDARDVDGWRDAMARVIRDDDWLAELRRGVCDQARPFTWERCAAQTWQVYRRIVGTPSIPFRQAA